MERLGVRMRVRAASRAVRTAELMRVKLPRRCPTRDASTESHSLHGVSLVECKCRACCRS